MFFLLPNINSYSNKTSAWQILWEHKSQYIPLMWWGIHLETLRAPCPFVSWQEGSCCSSFRTEQQGHSEACWDEEPWWEAQEHCLLGHSHWLKAAPPASICFPMFQCTPTQKHSSRAGSKAELKLERIISDRLINEGWLLQDLTLCLLGGVLASI